MQAKQISKRLTLIWLNSIIQIKTVPQMPRKNSHQSTSSLNNRSLNLMLFNQSAYETLSDESKRKVYDSTGMTGDEQMNSDFHGQDPFSSFKDFWGG